MRYRFSHDRYRESIFGSIEPTAKRTIHGHLAQSVRVRWGENAETYPLLAEHYFGAEDYARAYQNAHKVAEQASAEGNHERAADYFRMALNSHSLASSSFMDNQALHKLRDQAAESLAAVGRFEEANAQLRVLLEAHDVPKPKQLDCQRRIAESYYIQQDFRNATEQLRKLLLRFDVDVQEKGLKRALNLLRGGFALLVRGPFRLGLNRQVAKNPSEEMMIVRTLYALAECTLFTDARVTLYVIIFQVHRIMTQGLHPFSGVIMGSLSYACSVYGMPSLSLRYESLIHELFPEFAEPAQKKQTGPLLASSAGLGPQSTYEAQATIFLYLAGIRLSRGDLLDSSGPPIAYYIHQVVRIADRAANIQKRGMARSCSYTYCLFTGRISCFEVLLQASIDMFRRTRIIRQDDILTPFRKAVPHEVAGNSTQAALHYQEAADWAQKHESFLHSLKARASALFCLALDVSVPPNDLAMQALQGADEWLQRRMAAFTVFSLGSFLAAGAVSLARQNKKEIPPEFLSTMRRARRQALAEHQHRPLYLAADATLHWIKGHKAQALAQFAEATTDAAQRGYLFQLLSVLRVAVCILPKSHTAQHYYQEWLRQLQRNLHEKPQVKLRDVEEARFPAMPSAGQPAFPPPR